MTQEKFNQPDGEVAVLPFLEVENFNKWMIKKGYTTLADFYDIEKYKQFKKENKN